MHVVAVSLAQHAFALAVLSDNTAVVEPEDAQRSHGERESYSDRSSSAVRWTLKLRSAWRQWHHWNIAPGIAELRLPKGKSILTVHILTAGQMNLATFDFKKVR